MILDESVMRQLNLVPVPGDASDAEQNCLLSVIDHCTTPFGVYLKHFQEKLKF